MRFGKTLRTAVHEPWTHKYIDYSLLKLLLRENETVDGDALSSWTDEDESRFVEELVNIQLEKVNNFQVETYKTLRERTSSCESRLENFVGLKNNASPDNQTEALTQPDTESLLDSILDDLDKISKEINELERYSRINFTGFLKAAKKHDRRRGLNYKVRPLLHVRLAALPFNSEDYSPLLYRLSALYSYIRQNVDDSVKQTYPPAEINYDSGKYTSHKFFIHLDNLLEVKTYILRHLPVLVYNPQASKVVRGSEKDPTITSLYFDNDKFSLYTKKVEKAAGASSVRLRWFGQLADKPEIFIEKKTLGEKNDSKEIRFPIKEKYIMPFIQGEYKMEKSIHKLQDRKGEHAEEVNLLQNSVNNIGEFIQEYEIQPVLRANYMRTAFQIPGDDRVRISIDTNLTLIREDALDSSQPFRGRELWHRTDIDDNSADSPFSRIRKDQICKFPHAVLEIKVKNGTKKKTSEWISDLTSSHLVKEAPRFSKFVHGVAQLFEDHINTFPFWLSILETDIRKEPGEAFEEEQDKRAKQAEDESVIGSFGGSKSAASFTATARSSTGKSALLKSSFDPQSKSRASAGEKGLQGSTNKVVVESNADGESPQIVPHQPDTAAGLRSLFPSFSASKYARGRRESRNSLPSGVYKPGRLIKDCGPVRVEPKVWLANQRTFIKWEHVSVLLASLSLGLYNAAGQFNNVARGLATIYTLVAVLAGTWGWWLYIVRSRMIEQRSGKEFDNVFGPVIVCLGLVLALCLNFGLQVTSAGLPLEELDGLVHRVQDIT